MPSPDHRGIVTPERPVYRVDEETTRALVEALEDILLEAERTRLVIGTDLRDSIFVLGRAALRMARREDV